MWTLGSDTSQMAGLGQIGHRLCASQALGNKCMQGLLETLRVCHPHHYHSNDNEFLGFLSRYGTRIIIPSLLQ